jgi:hypothetical protein
LLEVAEHAGVIAGWGEEEGDGEEAVDAVEEFEGDVAEDYVDVCVF